jgi:hypothetical protein
MRVIGIDPGPRQSGWCDIETATGKVLRSGVSPNQFVLEHVQNSISFDPRCEVHIEMVANYGRNVGKDVFYSLLWAGRFVEAAGKARLVTRPEVCRTLCGTTKTDKAGVWAAVCDLYGGKELAVGKKATPGPLYGVKDHARDAVAVVKAVLAAAATVESEVFG